MTTVHTQALHLPRRLRRLRVSPTVRALVQETRLSPEMFVLPLFVVEGRGVRRLTRDLCDELVYIPMAGSVESLNVSVATGIVLFELLRQAPK